MTDKKHWIAITVILLAAAVLRLCGLGDVPPGLSHDEVANWLIARDILDGNHAIYFTAAYGHEPLYQYVQAGTVALFGDHWLGLRWPSVAFSLLGIAASHTLTRRLFGRAVAYLASGWLAVSFWPVFYARVAYRAILLPLTAVLTAYFLVRAARRSSKPLNNFPPSVAIDTLLAGLFLGISMYTYTAARVLPLLIAAAVVYAKKVCPHECIPWSRLLAIMAIAALVSAPLVVWLANHPSAEHRVTEVREPLDKLLAGDPSLAWENLMANLKFFVISGDPWARYNIPGRPVFVEPVSGALFLAGLLIAVRHWRDPQHGALLIWLLGSLAPSVVTTDPPSSIRNILGLAAVFAFPGLASVEVWRRVRSHFRSSRVDVPGTSSLAFYVLGFAILTPCLLSTVRDYFVRWPQNQAVRFDYQADLTAVGEELVALDEEMEIVVSGLSVHTLDRPTLHLASRGNVADVRLCDTRETLVVPSARSGNGRLLVPDVVPLDDDIRTLLMRWGAKETRESSFTSYRLPGQTRLSAELAELQTGVLLPDGTQLTAPVSFEGRLSFLGFEHLTSGNAEGVFVLLTYWRVEELPLSQLKVFAHAVNQSGEVIGQDDGLGSPSDSWQRDDVLVQKHVLGPASGLSLHDAIAIRIGVYSPAWGARLAVLGSDHLQIPFKRGAE